MSKIKIHDPFFGREERRAVEKVFESHLWASPKDNNKVSEFEKKFQSYLKCDECVAVDSGSAALLLSLSLMDIKNKEVIIGLDGNPISREDFMKNDQGITMEPFFSGEGPPAINFNDSRKLSSHQGSSEYRYLHRDQRGNGVNLNLPPQKYASGNPYGMRDTGRAMDQDRYIPGMYKTNEKGFEDEKVPHISVRSGINRDIGEIYAQRNSP